MKKLTRLLFLFCFFFILSSNHTYAQQGTYPQVDINGFKKWEYKKADVNPTKNYFSGLTQLGGYYPTFSGGPWQERLQLRIFGKLAENLSASYDLEQQPETPERYNVKVKYYENELTFGDISANFSGNEFAESSKFLNGVMLTGKDSWYNLLLVPSSKLKSQTQNLTSQKGTNTKGPYNLGHGSIIEGSERISLNGNDLSRNIDYTIDYFEGKITFNRILTTLDEFKYSYSYTNIIDLFFPALSKRDFFGLQSRFTIDPEEFGRPTPVKEPVLNTVRENFPTLLISEDETQSEIFEEESSGRYRLKNVPVAEFSESLNFMGSKLKRNEDYVVRYNEGEIKLLTRFLPTQDDPLIVEYKYFQTSRESETIQGIDSRGPYKLSHPHLVPDSEKIEVDGKLYMRNLDYQINYQTGVIIFGVIISSTSQINAQYRYNVMELPPQTKSKFPKEVLIGTTYLRETAKAGGVSTTATAIESKTGQEIINDDYHLYLQNRPVLPSTEASYYFLLTVDGRTLTAEVDYSIPQTVLDPLTGFYHPTPEATLAYINDKTDPSDGYDTGTIKFIDTSLITSTSEVIVSYVYYKSIVGRYSGSGNGTRGPYYLRNIRNIAPGSETVQVWDQGSSVITTYTRNSSFEADAGEKGYSINYQSDNPHITFNNELITTKNFQIIYQYVPPSGFTSQDISQSVLGLDGEIKIGDILKIDTAYAKSETDQLISRVPTSESTTGNGGKTYTLHSPAEIIEDSEKIYVNDKLVNKDIDYFFTYSKPGQVTFYYISPATQDAIRIDYDYQSSSASATDVKIKTGHAYRLGAETKFFGDVLAVSGTSKKIDYDFSPMGGTSIGLGSEYQDYNIKYNPGIHSLSVNYAYKENHNPIGTYTNKFLRSYDNSISSTFNPRGYANITIDYRSYNTLDDLLPGSATHNNDAMQESYSLSIKPSDWKRGIISFNQKYDLRKTVSQSDLKRDSNNFSESDIGYGHANGNFKFTDRLSLGYDYQKSEPKTASLKEDETGTTVEATSSHSYSTDNAYNIAVDLTAGHINKWTARVNFLTHEEKTLTKNFVSTDEASTTKNETYHTDFIPFSILTSSLDHNRQERSSYVTGGSNPKNERTAANINLIPCSWFSTNWSGSQSEVIPETGIQNKTTGKNNTYNINYSPFSFNNFKLNSRFTLSSNDQTGPSGTAEVTTNTNSFSQNYNINLIPHPLFPLTLGYTIENYNNKNNHPVTTSRIDTETQNQTFDTGLTVNPNPSLNLSSRYYLKTTKVIRDLNLSPQERNKTELENKVTYQITSWGTLVYNRKDEKNGGEIQAGSVAALNIEKTTQDYSLNITIPVDNPVLSDFVFRASLKTVGYKNLDNSGDNFTASLASFDGTLNF